MRTKPILFNTDMVRGLLPNRKTATRRVVKPQYGADADGGTHSFDAVEKNRFRWSDHPNVWTAIPYPYRPGDILYVRETWCPFDADHVIDGVKYAYKADATPESERIRKEYGYKWHPSIHMPREAARIFLRVTDVRVERLQESFFKHGSTIFSLREEGIDIGEQCRECIETYGSPCCIDDESECGVLDEVRGMFADLWNRCYAKPRPIKGEDGTIDHYESYPWEDIQETRTYRGKPWYVIGNPWVWAIEFERISREEAIQHG